MLCFSRKRRLEKKFTKGNLFQNCPPIGYIQWVNERTRSGCDINQNFRGGIRNVSFLSFGSFLLVHLLCSSLVLKENFKHAKLYYPSWSHILLVASMLFFCLPNRTLNPGSLIAWHLQDSLKKSNAYFPRKAGSKERSITQQQSQAMNII